MDMFSRVNWVDVLIAIIMFRMSYVALQDGLSHEIFPLVASICTAVLSLQFYRVLAIYFSGNVFGMSVGTANLISFVLLFVLFSFVFRLIKAVLDKIIKVTWHPVLEKLGGLMAGMVRASIVSSIILIILTLMPFSYFTLSIKEKSLTGMYFLKIAPKIYETVVWAIPMGGSNLSANSEDIIKDLLADKPVPKENNKTKKLIPSMI